MQFFLHGNLHSTLMVTATCRSQNKMVKIIYFFTQCQTYRDYQFTILSNIFIAMLMFSVVVEGYILMFETC
jgi:hypothetical protein